VEHGESGQGTVGASADLGSNSVHLLVARLDGHRIEILADESAFLGLGSAVADHGYLGNAKRAELTATLARFAAVARSHDAAAITFIGTEPIRRAADAASIAADVKDIDGAILHVLSHEEEAYLTIIGVTEGMPVTHETLVIDVGGGSSEFCVVDPVHRPRAAGIRLGSARLTDRFATNDPPTAADVANMRAAAAEALAGAPAANPAEIIAVGGTASNLVKVLPAAIQDRMLTRDRIAEIQSILAEDPAAAASERHLINPIRARILPAGAAIVDAILERYDAPSIRVSEAGLREGTILATAHAGPGWRDQLPNLAHGWRA
jgi:exopolyphosphatase/guanosine-5'-triphosphate,3'-diphosphate pyrophosphatase